MYHPGRSTGLQVLEIRQISPRLDVSGIQKAEEAKVAGLSSVVWEAFLAGG
jgi:hypothetical protein